MNNTMSARWAAMPLSTRLIIGLLAVISSALIVVGLATFLALRSWMVEQIDNSLMQPKSHLYADGGDPRRINEAIQSWIGDGATVIILSPDGRAVPLAQGINGQQPAALPAADAAALATVPAGPTTRPVNLTLSTLGKTKATALTALDQGNQRVTVVAVLALSRINALVGRLFAIELITIGLALLISWLLSAWFIRRSFKPLQEVAETASEVAQLPLGRGDVTIPARVANPIPTTEVGQVGLAVNAMLDHVEESLQTRAETEDRLRQFVSDAGHELRTPLAAVRGYSELLRRGVEQDPEAARLAASRIEGAASRMGLLVDDLLLLASLDEQRPLAKNPVDIRTIIDDTQTEAKTTGPDHRWVVDDAVKGEVFVAGDELRLHQTLSNLYANARNYTPAGTTITTTLSVLNNTAMIEVRDDGPGFPADLLPRITERFVRGDASRARTTGGTGLGLAIVKVIVEAHDGRIEIANGAPGTGVGAVVRIAIPMVALDDSWDDDFDESTLDEAFSYEVISSDPTPYPGGTSGIASGTSGIASGTSGIASGAQNLSGVTAARSNSE
jgi:two-component system OmpR family sensor kinase